jgi:hypothetical protein
MQIVPLIWHYSENETELLKGLAIALSGLEQGEISLGMKKRRGFGRCHVKEWQVWNFNLENASDRTAWLKFEHWHTGLFPELPSYPQIQEAFTRANLSNARFYYDRGYIKIEMSPLGVNHSRDHSVVARLISLFDTLKNIRVIEFTNVTFYA